MYQRSSFNQPCDITSTLIVKILRHFILVLIKNKQTIKFAVSTVDRLTVESRSEVIIGFIDGFHDLLLEMREGEKVDIIVLRSNNGLKK